MQANRWRFPHTRATPHGTHISPGYCAASMTRGKRNANAGCCWSTRSSGPASPRPVWCAIRSVCAVRYAPMGAQASCASIPVEIFQQPARSLSGLESVGCKSTLQVRQTPRNECPASSAASPPPLLTRVIYRTSPPWQRWSPGTYGSWCSWRSGPHVAPAHASPAP